MKCLIIAAGKGSRLQLRGESKPLIPLFGVPLIERVIGTAKQAGANDFYVVTGFRAHLLEPFLKDLSDRLSVPIKTLHNPDWNQENGLSVLAGRDHLKEAFLLLMADHIFDPKTAKKLIENPPPDGEISLAVDRNLDSENINPADVTRVKLREGKIADIGKGISDFDGYDTGVFVCTPVIFDAIEESAGEKGDSSLSGAVRILADSGKANAIDFYGEFWVDVDDPDAIRKAENALLENMGIGFNA